jgi:uncharacterized delta-60 repeat protein
MKVQTITEARRCYVIQDLQRVLLAVVLLLGLPFYFRASAASAASGDLDPTFGTGGKVTTNFFNYNDQVDAVAMQSDGKIVVAGFANLSTGGQISNFALARYNTDGTLDTTFGTGGKVNTDFLGFGNTARSIVIQPDGKIVAAGYASNGAGTIHFALARYNTNGTLDTSFGTGGKVTTNISDTGDGAFAVAIQADGKIVAAGATLPSASSNVQIFALARYNTDGSLDTSFGIGGKVTTSFSGTYDEATAVVIQSDGKIIAAGHAHSDSSRDDFALARFNTNGTLDTSFGTGGKVTTDFSGLSDFVASAVIQSDGKIVAAGTVETSATQSAFALARYNTNGSLDTTFGTVGKVTTNFTSSQDQANAIAIQSDGKIIVAGFAPNSSTFLDFALARYNTNGSLDASFGVGGKVTTDFFGDFDAANAVAIQSDGKIVAAGYAYPNGGQSHSDFALARYINDGASLPTPTGSNVTVTSGDASVTFAQVTNAGTTTFTLIDPNSAGAPPSGYTIATSVPGYDITTTAVYTPPIDICFYVPSFNDATAFSKLRILHGENGVLVDRTFRQDYSARQICARVSSLSPFVLAMTDTPFPNSASQLLNISTRMRVLTGDNVLIGGFIITGTDPKRVIIRGMGPSLNGVGVTLSDPTLELHQGSTTLATNDNWKINDQTGQSQEADIRATTIPPTNDLESSILTTLSPGAYTAILAGKNGGTGVGLVEVYDLAQAAISKLANISTRGFVDTGDNVMIGGLIVGGGSGGGTARVIVRALGPSVPVNGTLSDPTLELRNASGTMIVTNDNWKTRPDGSSQQAEIEATTIPPTNDLESALVATLAPGNYTAIVRGKNNTTGVGLIEVYNIQ